MLRGQPPGGHVGVLRGQGFNCHQGIMQRGGWNRGRRGSIARGPPGGHAERGLGGRQGEKGQGVIQKGENKMENLTDLDTCTSLLKSQYNNTFMHALAHTHTHTYTHKPLHWKPCVLTTPLQRDNPNPLFRKS